LGSKYKFTEVQARHWDQFAQAVGLSPAQTRKRVLRMAHDLPAMARQLQMSDPFCAQPITGRIVVLIEARAALMVTRLTASATDIEEE
jgi:serine/threonine-protein kinase HipA